MDGFGFSKQLRLNTPKDYQRVFNDVQLKSGEKAFLCLAKANDLAYPRLGLIAPKKHLKLAVDRNRVKRIVRDSFRLNQHDLVGLDIVVLVRSKYLKELSSQRQLALLEGHWSRLISKFSQRELEFKG
ncbi:MAG: ribonuclease P protein component [Moraxellaceae bacterium]|nr:MAG: ribonuclease P protein component [Moraxellaceae bacterium]